MPVPAPTEMPMTDEAFRAEFDRRAQQMKDAADAYRQVTDRDPQADDIDEFERLERASALIAAQRRYATALHWKIFRARSVMADGEFQATRDEMYKAFEDAFKLNDTVFPGSPRAQRFRQISKSYGVALLEVNEPALAFEAFKNALDDGKEVFDDPRVNQAYGVALLEAGDFAEAIRVSGLVAAQDVAPLHRTYARWTLALAHEGQLAPALGADTDGHADEARRELETAYSELESYIVQVWGEDAGSVPLADALARDTGLHRFRMDLELLGQDLDRSRERVPPVAPRSPRTPSLADRLGRVAIKYSDAVAQVEVARQALTAPDQEELSEDTVNFLRAAGERLHEVLDPSVAVEDGAGTNANALRLQNRYLADLGDTATEALLSVEMHALLAEARNILLDTMETLAPPRADSAAEKDTRRRFFAQSEVIVAFINEMSAKDLAVIERVTPKGTEADERARELAAGSTSAANRLEAVRATFNTGLGRDS